MNASGVITELCNKHNECEFHSECTIYYGFESILLLYHNLELESLNFILNLIESELWNNDDSINQN